MELSLLEYFFLIPRYLDLILFNFNVAYLRWKAPLESANKILLYNIANN